jgi:hypothetical protein
VAQGWPIPAHARLAWIASSHHLPTSSLVPFPGFFSFCNSSIILSPDSLLCRAPHQAILSALSSLIWLLWPLHTASKQTGITVTPSSTPSPTPSPTPPCINANPTLISFPLTQNQGNTALQSVMSPLHNNYPVWLTNCGDTGNWSGTPRNDWLYIIPTQGLLKSGALTQVVVGANSSNLIPGTYTGSITFTITTSAGQSSKVVQVTLTVPPLTLTVTPGSIGPTNTNCSYDSVSNSDSCIVTLTNSSADGLLD